jgi:hypothetical protein
VLLATASGAASSFLEFTAFTGAYDNYAFTLEGLVPSISASNWLLTFSDAGGYFSSSYQWVQVFTSIAAAAGPTRIGSTGDTGVHFFDSTSNSNALQGTMFFCGTQQTAQYVTVHMALSGFNLSNQLYKIEECASHALTQAVTKAKFAMSTGTITSGTIRMYGISQ